MKLRIIKFLKKNIFVFFAVTLFFTFSACSYSEKTDSVKENGSNVKESETMEKNDKQFGISEYSEYKTDGSLYEHYICSYVSNGDGTYQRTRIDDVSGGENVSEEKQKKVTIYNPNELNTPKLINGNGEEWSYEYKYDNDNRIIQEDGFLGEDKRLANRTTYMYSDDLLVEEVHMTFDNKGNELTEYREKYNYNKHDAFGNPTHADYIDGELQEKGHTSEIFYEYDETGEYKTKEDQRYYMSLSEFTNSESYNDFENAIQQSEELAKQFESDKNGNKYMYQQICTETDYDNYGNILKNVETHMFYSELFSRFVKEYKYIELL